MHAHTLSEQQTLYRMLFVFSLNVLLFDIFFPLLEPAAADSSTSVALFHLERPFFLPTVAKGNIGSL